MNARQLPPVPPRDQLALPAPGKTYTQERADDAIAQMRSILGRKATTQEAS